VFHHGLLDAVSVAADLRGDQFTADDQLQFPPEVHDLGLYEILSSLSVLHAQEPHEKAPEICLCILTKRPSASQQEIQYGPVSK